MKLYLFLAIGAIAGAFGRYGIGLWLSSRYGAPPGFPWSTFVINLTGSFLLGFLIRYLTETAISREVRTMLTVGFCGSYTTFSTFSYELMGLLNEGERGVALLYAGSSAIGGPAMCMAGYALAGMVLMR